MEKHPRKHPLELSLSGGSEKLVSFRMAKLLYDVTVRFVDRNIPVGSRTKDQMEQAARSGVRNIAEGSMISATTKKLEMNLTSVAPASLDKLQKGCLEEPRTDGARSYRSVERGAPKRAYWNEVSDQGATKYVRTRASAYAGHTCLHRRRSEVLRGTQRTTSRTWSTANCRCGRPWTRAASSSATRVARIRMKWPAGSRPYGSAKKTYDSHYSKGSIARERHAP